MTKEPTEYQQIAARFAELEAKLEREEAAAQKREDAPTAAPIQFKTQHLLAILFFSWFLYVSDIFGEPRLTN